MRGAGCPAKDLISRRLFSPCYGGPRVRIHLPPAASQVRTSLFPRSRPLFRAFCPADRSDLQILPRDLDRLPRRQRGTPPDARVAESSAGHPELRVARADAPSSTGVGGPKVQPCSRRIFSTSLLPLHPSSCWLKSFPDNVRELLPPRLSLGTRLRRPRAPVSARVCARLGGGAPRSRDRL